MKNFIFLFAVVSVFFSGTSKVVKPNIVYIYADQWRGEAMGYAGNKDVMTPNLDKLASEGVTFTNAISTTPVCTPHRAMMLTGQYILKTGMFMNDVSLDPEIESFGKIYKKAGYATAFIGKWHVDGNGRSGFIPKERRQGFDYWKALECSHSYNNSMYWGNDDKTHNWEGYDAESQTKDAISYISNQVKKKEPFMLMMAWGPPHNPYSTAPEEFQKLYKNKKITLRPNVPESKAEETKAILKGYYAHCTALDTYIKQLQDAIKSNKIEKNTIFVFTSDHGDMLGSQGMGKKQKIYEESVKVPFIIKYPALLGINGKKSDFLLNTMDILPTLMAMSGLKPNRDMDGENITNVLLGKQKDEREASLVSLPQPFGEWNRSVGGKEFRGIVTKRYTYARDLQGRWLLFDNLMDPYQQTNMVDEPSATSLVKNLDALLDKELDRLGDKFLHGDEYVKLWGYKVDKTGTVPYR